MFSHRLSRARIAAIWVAIALAGTVLGWFGYRSHRADLLADLVDDAKRSAVAFDPLNMRALAGTREDLNNPIYVIVKDRLRRLQSVNPQVHFVYIFRFVPETGRVVFLGDSAAPGAKDESRPGDDYPQATESPGLQAVIRSGLPATEGPLRDGFGTWITGYALIAEAPSAKPGVPTREILGLDIDATRWSGALWSAAFQRAFYVWILLGLPFTALLVLRRQFEQREAIRNLSEAMEQSHSALMIVDLSSCIEYANRGLCQQIGYSRRELIGRSWRDFQVAETPPEVLADLVATVRSGHAWEGEWFNRRKNGTIYPVRGVITPVKRRDGVLSCFIAVFDDMTEIKRNEGELREARDLALAGDRAKGQFLATMSHEVRTPLNGIVGFTNLLLSTPLTPEQRDYVQTIHTSGEALISLTGDILDFARIESGKLKLDPQACDPRDCVEDALDLAAARAQEKHLELLHRFEDDVPATILVDGGRLRQVLGNLVTNAVKFTEAGEIEVLVAVASEGPETGKTPASAARPLSRGSCLLRFSVRDTGIGIPANQHGKLFRPFSQLDATTTRKYSGTGLGLAICKNLVEHMGGGISCVSAPGVGSTFTFTVRVPVVTPAAPVPDLGGLRLALIAKPGPGRAELARLAACWRAIPVEADTLDALTGVAWDTALVVVDEPRARELAVPGASTGLPPAQCFALVPLTLPSDLRTALRAHFRLLVNRPVHQAALPPLLRGTARPSGSTSPFRSFGLRVLLVEDNDVNQRLMQRVLTNLGCTWKVAADGRQAVDELTRAAAEYDLVLLDLHMPEMDGITALGEIRAGRAGRAAQGIWIAALTADARDEQRERVMAAGANDYLVKPLRVSELETTFRRCRGAREESRAGL